MLPRKQDAPVDTYGQISGSTLRGGQPRARFASSALDRPSETSVAGELRFTEVLAAEPDRKSTRSSPEKYVWHPQAVTE